eukprot:GHVL01026912.1.p1 GENE.GHVL01026912.1~~GHVL01026912.1.p1  ORF type:complete len:303 (-),score=102.22 GHVL01026912.1:68-976(-)
MGARLKQLEELNRNRLTALQKNNKKLREVEKEKNAALNEISVLKKSPCGELAILKKSIKSLEDRCEIYQKKVELMEMVINEKLNKKIPVNICKLLENIEEISESINKERIICQDGGIHRLSYIDEFVYIIFLYDGLILDGKYGNYDEDNIQDILKDIMDGYVPFCLNNKYPDGVSLQPIIKTDITYTNFINNKKYNIYIPDRVINKNGDIIQSNNEKIIKNIGDCTENYISLHIRLLNGNTITCLVNIYSKISDIYNFLKFENYINEKIILLGGYPPKILNLNITVIEADLHPTGNLVVQKL